MKAELTQELEGLKMNRQANGESKSLFKLGSSFNTSVISARTKNWSKIINGFKTQIRPKRFLFYLFYK